ncbi:MAG TPA: SRPBCC family protein [Actinomycetota bacterium]|nr:SRPBCC family protein [Actinomycetota bacterium]
MAYVNRASFTVNASPEEAFALISDLTRSPEWASNPLKVEVVSGGPVGLGTKYRSEAKFMGKDVHAEQEVTAYEPPTHFAFTNTEGHETYEHVFTVRAQNGKSLIERTITFHVPGFRGVMIRFVVPIVSKKFDRQNSEKLNEVFPSS